VTLMGRVGVIVAGWGVVLASFALPAGARAVVPAQRSGVRAPSVRAAAVLPRACPAPIPLLCGTTSPSPPATPSPIPTPTPPAPVSNAAGDAATGYLQDPGRTAHTSDDAVAPPLVKVWTHRFDNLLTYPVIAGGRVFVGGRRTRREPGLRWSPVRADSGYRAHAVAGRGAGDILQRDAGLRRRAGVRARPGRGPAGPLGVNRRAVVDRAACRGPLPGWRI